MTASLLVPADEDIPVIAQEPPAHAEHMRTIKFEDVEFAFYRLSGDAINPRASAVFLAWAGEDTPVYGDIFISSTDEEFLQELMDVDKRDIAQHAVLKSFSRWLEDLEIQDNVFSKHDAAVLVKDYISFKTKPRISKVIIIDADGVSVGTL